MLARSSDDDQRRCRSRETSQTEDHTRTIRSFHKRTIASVRNIGGATPELPGAKSG